MSHARPPILVAVGHIDHGKSRLQQALRKVDTAPSESGNITQHIGAYEMRALYEGAERRATVIDTPGHTAFSHIREHGIDLADIALLVVSSEEGWKEQTGEAYSAIQKTRIPHIVVFTKIDIGRSNLERAKQTVLRNGVLLEGSGGQVPWIAVSSVTGEGISDLVDLIFLTADVYEAVDDRQDSSVGVLVETHVDPRIGIAGTIIVLRDSLDRTNYVRVGHSVAPLRIMEDDRGNPVTSAVPSSPVRVFGFDSIPPIGEPVFAYSRKKEALEDAKKERSAVSGRPPTPSDSPGISLPVVLRSDTASGLTSARRALDAAAADGTAFTVIKAAVGAITEEDARLALTELGGAVIGFHTGADQRAEHFAKHNDVTLHLFPTIYEVTDWATSVSAHSKESHEMAHPTGTANVIRLFDEQSRRGAFILGATMIDGTISVRQRIALVRDGATVGRFLIASIERRNTAQERVSGSGVQFALRAEGDGSAALGDTILGLPDLSAGQ